MLCYAMLRYAYVTCNRTWVMLLFLWVVYGLWWVGFIGRNMGWIDEWMDGWMDGWGSCLLLCME